MLSLYVFIIHLHSQLAPSFTVLCIMNLIISTKDQNRCFTGPQLPSPIGVPSWRISITPWHSGSYCWNDEDHSYSVGVAIDRNLTLLQDPVGVEAKTTKTMQTEAISELIQLVPSPATLMKSMREHLGKDSMPSWWTLLPAYHLSTNN